MKKMKLLLVTLAAIPLGITSLQAQVDVTGQYLVNPSFEGASTLLTESTEAMDLGTGGGGVYCPEGWSVSGSVNGWKGIDIRGGEGDAANAAICTDGEFLLNLWCATLNYVELSQTVTGLPNGLYTITCDMLVSGPDGSTSVAGQRIFANGSESRFPQEWETPNSEGGDFGVLHTLSVSATVTDGTLTFGIRTDNIGNPAGGWMKADNFRLFLNGSDPEEVIAYLKDEIQKKLLSVSEKDWGIGAVPGGYSFLGNPESDLIKQAYELAENGTDVELMGSIISSLETYLGKYETLRNVTLELGDCIEECYSIIQTSDPELFTGIPEFTQFYYRLVEMFNSETALEGDFEQALEDYKPAKQALLLSQHATIDSPADFTSVLLSPEFTKPGGDASLVADQLATGWTSTRIAVSGDFRMNTVGGKNCWNSWSPDFTEMKIAQELTNLPAGLYAISCETATDGEIHDQHAFVSSSGGTAVSPVPATLTPSGEFPGGGLWEMIETEKVLVLEDGKLTLGMASTSGGGTSGWFCATNFKLYYYGNENAAEEYAKAFTERIAYAKELTEEEMLASERNVLKASISEAERADVSSVEKIETAFSALNEGVDAAETGAGNLKVFKSRSYKTLAETAAAYLETEDLATLGNVFIDYIASVNTLLAADTTTSSVYNALDSLIKVYIDFGNSFNTALAYKDPVTYDAEALTRFGTALESIAKSLESLDPEDVVAAHYELNDAIFYLKDYSSLESRDVSFWITNPGLDETTYDNGWNNEGFVRNTALLTKDDGYTGKYCAETWIAYNSGLADKTFSQKLYVPSGTYSLSVVATACQQGSLEIYEEDGETIRETVTLTTPVKGVWLFANEDSVEIATPMRGESAPYENETVSNEPHSEVFTLGNIEVVNEGMISLNIGVKTRSTTANWVAFDNFKLTCVVRTGLVGIEDVTEETEVPFAYVENGCIKVMGTEQFTVTTVDGKAVSSQAQLAPGIYIVKAGTQAVKVFVNK